MKINRHMANICTDNLTIILPPEDPQYGQRRMLIKAPEGSLIDISSFIK